MWAIYRINDGETIWLKCKSDAEDYLDACENCGIECILGFFAW